MGRELTEHDVVCKDRAVEFVSVGPFGVAMRIGDLIDGKNEGILDESDSGLNQQIVIGGQILSNTPLDGLLAPLLPPM